MTINADDKVELALSCWITAETKGPFMLVGPSFLPFFNREACHYFKSNQWMTKFGTAEEKVALQAQFLFQTLELL